MSKRVLIIGDDGSIPSELLGTISSQGYIAEYSAGSDELGNTVKRAETAAVILNLIQSGSAGLNLVPALNRIDASVPVILIVASHQTRLIVEGLKLGAADSLVAPVQVQDLIEVLDTLVQARHAGRPAPEGRDFRTDPRIDPVFMLSSDPKMRQIWEVAKTVARTDVPVLILGESGVGKEVLARYIHAQSPRLMKPLLKVNCAALPQDLLESELFGYERGAFTGAVAEKPGKFELADKGCILLDEIGEMTPNLQAKLLHVLEDREYYRLGGKSSIQIDVRILALTNRNLEEAVPRGEFREDLYFRLNVIMIRSPPLREHKEDIAFLCEHFLKKHRGISGTSLEELPPQLVKTFLDYHWPGNVRELENTIKRYLILPEIDIHLGITGEYNLPIARSSAAASTKAPLGAASRSHVVRFAAPMETFSLKQVAAQAADKAERELVLRVLEETNWNRKHAARRLSICYRALLNKLKKWEIRSRKAS